MGMSVEQILPAIHRALQALALVSDIDAQGRGGLGTGSRVAQG